MDPASPSPRWATPATTRIGQQTPSAAIAKLLGAPLAPAQISLDAPRRLGRSYGIDDGASPSYGMGGMRRRDLLTPGRWLGVVSPPPGRENDVNQIDPNAAATSDVSAASTSSATTSAPIKTGQAKERGATPEPSVSLWSRTIDPSKKPSLRVPGRRFGRPRSTKAMTRAASRLGVLLLAVVFLAVVPTAAGAKDTVAFTIKDSRITESSGLAVDYAGYLYWTVNDSDDRGVVYGIGLDGTVRGTLNFRAQPRDVEAVAMCKNRLYVADIGDNNARRRFVRVYIFTNPRPDGLTVTYHAYDFRYPDGPHDAETLLIDDCCRLFIVTKGPEAAIYEAPANPERQGVNELEQVGLAPSNVTDGTFLPGGDRIALLTYSSVEVIDATSYEFMASVPIPSQPRAESLTLNMDQSSLLVGSEGKKSKVYSVRVPGEPRPSTGRALRGQPEANSRAQGQPEADSQAQRAVHPYRT